MVPFHPSMSSVVSQGELLALHRSLELVLCDGVEEALANCISEIAGLGGGVHTLAREEVRPFFVARRYRFI